MRKNDELLIELLQSEWKLLVYGSLGYATWLAKNS